MYIHICKPFLGSLLAGIALIILIPLLLTVSVLLVLSTGKSPFFLQTRVGYRGRLFKIIKFKTMNDRKDENGQLLPDEQRLFPLGRFLRSSSLDELPQLINILKGDMSIVGPRPTSFAASTWARPQRRAWSLSRSAKKKNLYRFFLHIKPGAGLFVACLPTASCTLPIVFFSAADTTYSVYV